ncbi:hypothetical protein LINPERPRIM_LOCUS20573 [Linum perenne]
MLMAYIHKCGLFLRRSFNGIKPICYSPTTTPEWILLRNVSLVLITMEGISWVSIKIGKPLNKFVREGWNVRVCVLRDKSIPCPEVVKVEMEDDVIEIIEVLSFQARAYKKGDVVKGKEPMPMSGNKVWVIKDQVGGKEESNSVASTSGEKTDIRIPEEAKRVYETPSSVEIVKESSANDAGTWTSKTKKRRKNRKKNLDKALQSDSASQPI